MFQQILFEWMLVLELNHDLEKNSQHIICEISFRPTALLSSVFLKKLEIWFERLNVPNVD